MGISKTIGLLVLEGIFIYILNGLLDPIKGFILNEFTSQNFPINDVLAGVGISIIVATTVIATLLILQLRNYVVNRTLNIVIPDKTPNEKLDDLLQEMESFQNKWRYSSMFITGYRRRIEIDAMGGDRKAIKKIIQYSTNIYTKISLVKKLGVATINSKLDEMMPAVINLTGLGEDLREFYRTVKKSKTVTPEDKSKLLSNGDHTCGQFDKAIYELRILRKDLP